MTRTKTILSAAAATGFFLITPPSRASAPDLRDAPDLLMRTDRGIQFTYNCDPYRSSGSVSATFGLDPRRRGTEGFAPKCALVGTDQKATYLCQCTEDAASVVGELEGSELFPEGIPDQDEKSSENSILEDLSISCRNVLSTHCGPFPDPLRVPCQSEQGACIAAAASKVDPGEYDLLITSCHCFNSGRHWSNEDELLEPVPISKAQAEELCQAELKNCAPEAKPGPSETKLFDPALVISRSVECAHFGEGGPSGKFNPELCSLTSDSNSGTYRCSVDHEVISGDYNVDELESRGQIFDRCEELRKRFLPPKQDPSDDENGENDEDDEDNEDKLPDILDKLGCSVGSKSHTTAGYWALLALIAGVRRRRLWR